MRRERDTHQLSYSDHTIGVYTPAEVDASMMSKAEIEPHKRIHLENEDTFIFHSTYDGAFSMRIPDFGSWFIQTLCKHLEQIGIDKKVPLIDIILNVQRDIAYTRKAAFKQKKNQMSESEYIIHKQMPIIFSSLTKKVYI